MSGENGQLSPDEEIQKEVDEARREYHKAQHEALQHHKKLVNAAADFVKSQTGGDGSA